jgi:hypothetical protein
MNNNNTNDLSVVNGKRYSLWPQFVAKKDQWIGGTLADISDGEHAETKITDITFSANGDDSAAFSVNGEDFSCGSDVRCLAVDPSLGGNGWLGFSSAYGLKFKIKQATK